MMKFFRKRKNIQKIPMIILVVALTVGLVGSFALWSVPDVKKTAKGDELQNQQELLEKEIKKYQDLVANYKEELSQKPDNVEGKIKLADTTFNLALLLSQNNQTEEASQKFNECMKLYQEIQEEKPENADVAYRLAVAAAQAGKMGLAEDNFQKALSIDPENINYIANYGVYLIFSGNYEGAVEQFEKGLALNPNEDIKQRLESLIALAKSQMEDTATK